jgi:hypothetical protein
MYIFSNLCYHTKGFEPTLIAANLAPYQISMAAVLVLTVTEIYKVYRLDGYVHYTVHISTYNLAQKLLSIDFRYPEHCSGKYTLHLSQPSLLTTASIN